MACISSRFFPAYRRELSSFSGSPNFLVSSAAIKMPTWYLRLPSSWIVHSKSEFGFVIRVYARSLLPRELWLFLIQKINIPNQYSNCDLFRNTGNMLFSWHNGSLLCLLICRQPQMMVFGATNDFISNRGQIDRPQSVEANFPTVRPNISSLNPKAKFRQTLSNIQHRTVTFYFKWNRSAHSFRTDCWNFWKLSKCVSYSVYWQFL